LLLGLVTLLLGLPLFTASEVLTTQLRLHDELGQFYGDLFIPTLILGWIAVTAAVALLFVTDGRIRSLAGQALVVGPEGLTLERNGRVATTIP
jgi:hypothetical protein